MRCGRLARLVAAVAMATTLAACSGGSSGSTGPGAGHGSSTVALGYTAVSHGSVLHITGTPAVGFPALGTAPGITVVNLWAAWCAPCRKEAPVLTSAAARLHHLPVRFVGVDTEDSASRADSFARAHGWTWPQFYDSSGATLRSAGFLGLPDTVLLGPDGRIVGRYTGPITNAASFEATVTGLARRGP
jgi:thiol-disulfide isomerase/thioredoxin